MNIFSARLLEGYVLSEWEYAHLPSSHLMRSSEVSANLYDVFKMHREPRHKLWKIAPSAFCWSVIDLIVSLRFNSMLRTHVWTIVPAATQHSLQFGMFWHQCHHSLLHTDEFLHLKGPRPVMVEVLAYHF